MEEAPMGAGNGRAPKVSVITLNWNGRDDTLECLASLAELEYPNFEVIVVDNGSADGSVPAFRALHPEVTVIENGKNLGYAEGMNAGLRHAYARGAEYLLILNNDTTVHPSLLSELVRVAETDERIGFLSGKVYFHAEPNRLQTAGRRAHPLLLVHELVGWGEIDHGQYDQLQEYDYLDDIFLLVRRRAYEVTGGYDPNFFLYYEETDWCARVRRAGFRLVYVPTARVWHKHGRSTGGDRGRNFVYYMARNQIVFIRRHSSGGHWARYLCYLGTSSPRRIVRWLRERRPDLAGAYLHGVASGLLWVLGFGRRRPATV